MPRLLPLTLAGLVLASLALLGGCSGTAVLNAFASGGAAAVTTDVAYGPLPRQRLDVYRPASPSPAAGWPMVVFFYGGSWNSGERGDYRFVGEALASRGVLTLVADYRLYPQVSYPAFLDDSALAVAHAIGNAAALQADPARIFVMGHSAGAYNASMVALDDRWLAATGHKTSELAGFIGLAGPYDFLPTTVAEVKPVFHDPDYPSGAMPFQHLRAGLPPVFLGYAVKDSFVYPEKNSLPLAAALRDVGVPVRVAAYPRTSHPTLIGAFGRPLRWLAPVLDDVVDFIREPSAAAPSQATTPAASSSAPASAPNA